MARTVIDDNNRRAKARIQQAKENIIPAWTSGKSINEIAAGLNLTRQTVKQVITYLTNQDRKTDTEQAVTGQLTEEWDELWDNKVFNRFADGLQSNPHVYVSSQSLVERYKRNDCALHLHFLTAPGIRNEADGGFCAVLSRGGELVDGLSGFAKDGTQSCGPCDSDQYPPVLVSVRKAIKNVQTALLLDPLACHVRLQSLNLCSSQTGHPQKTVTLAVRNTGERFWGRTNGELVEVLGFISGCQYELPYKVVEGTAETMNNISDHKGNFWWDGPVNLQSLDVPIRVCVSLDHQFATIGVKIPMSLGIQCLEVGFKPNQFSE